MSVSVSVRVGKAGWVMDENNEGEYGNFVNTVQWWKLIRRIDHY